MSPQPNWIIWRRGSFRYGSAEIDPRFPEFHLPSHPPPNLVILLTNLPRLLRKSGNSQLETSCYEVSLVVLLIFWHKTTHLGTSATHRCFQDWFCVPPLISRTYISLPNSRPLRLPILSSVFCNQQVKPQPLEPSLHFSPRSGSYYDLWVGATYCCLHGISLCFCRQLAAQ